MKFEGTNLVLVASASDFQHVHANKSGHRAWTRIVQKLDRIVTSDGWTWLTVRPEGRCSCGMMPYTIPQRTDDIFHYRVALAP